jgi:hypothetical protein
MALGPGITTKCPPVWVRPQHLHYEYVSLLGLAFGIYHGLILIGDHFDDFSSYGDLRLLHRI